MFHIFGTLAPVEGTVFKCTLPNLQNKSQTLTLTDMLQKCSVREDMKKVCHHVESKFGRLWNFQNVQNRRT